MESKQQLPAPNYTQMPNVIFDEYMKVMGESELRVVLVAIRKIIGWHKSGAEPISTSQFEALTGMSNRGVIDGIQAAVNRGILVEAGYGARGVKLYTLNIQSTTTYEPTSQVAMSQPHRSNVTTYEPTSHTKERGKKRKESRAATPEIMAQDAIAQAWFDAIGGFGSAPTYYRTEAAQLIAQGATPELVTQMAREKSAGRDETYKLAWLAEDFAEWNAEQQRKAAAARVAAANKAKWEQERQWARLEREGMGA